MITLLGVGHVFDLSGAVREAVVSARPSIVAVELDPVRYQALVAGAVRPGSGVYGLLGRAQRRLARQYGTIAGGEMLTAIEAARSVGARVAFIDMDSATAVGRMFSQMSLKEKVRFALSAIAALFVRRRTVDREVAAYQADPVGFLDELGRRYPSVKRVLLDERNDHMARALRELEASSGDVIAVVGEGHVEGLSTGLSDRPLRVVRLQDLRR